MALLRRNTWGYLHTGNNQPDSVAGIFYPGYYYPVDRAGRIEALRIPRNSASAISCTVPQMLVPDGNHHGEGMRHGCATSAGQFTRNDVIHSHIIIAASFVSKGAENQVAMSFIS
ncbi:MAG: hypothetical protein ACKOOA_07420 [Sediminibacterium sp.]